MNGVLDGLKVLDLTWGLAGPKATMLLADHGADVTRIERPHGEPFAQPLGYRVWHRGKRSAALDLRDSDDLATFRRLADAAHGERRGARRDGRSAAAPRGSHPLLVSLLQILAALLRTR